MENLYYDLSEQEFSKGRKILLWIFAGIFLFAGISIVFMNVFLHDLAIHISYSIAPFGIAIFVGVVAVMATFKRKDHFFRIDNDKIEYRYGMFKPVRYSHNWSEVKEIHLPHKEKKVLLVYTDNTQYVVNLTWLEKKKTSHIRKHFYYAAKEKNIKVVKVNLLPKK